MTEEEKKEEREKAAAKEYQEKAEFWIGQFMEFMSEIHKEKTIYFLKTHLLTGPTWDTRPDIEREKFWEEYNRLGYEEYWRRKKEKNES